MEAAEVRATALTKAIDLALARLIEPSEVLSVAAKFESFLFGQG